MSNEQGEMSKGQIPENNEQGEMSSEQEGVSLFHVFCLLLALAVFVIEINRRKSSLLSFIMLSYSAGVRSLVSFNRSSQYSVSAHSFKEIVAFSKNSFLLIAYWASVRFAPIDVPERNSCLASTYSRFSSQRFLYRLYILIANLRLFSRAMLFIPISNIQKFGVQDK